MEDNKDSAKTTRRHLLLGALGGGAALALPGAISGAGVAYASSAEPSPEVGEGLPTGRQFQITSGGTSAIITEEGAGLRSFSFAGHEFLDTYSQNNPVDSSRGQVLIPFPNRIDGGAYVFNGVTEQLPLNDGANNNAIHGLTRWMNWNVQRRDEDRLVLSLVLHAQDGYPFVLSLQESYQVAHGTLWVKTTATNIGSSAAPYGVGHHPYLTVGTNPINTDTLRLPARSYFQTNSRLIPSVPAVPVAGTQFDFTTPHAIGTTVLDTGFTDLIFDADGFARVKFSAPGGKPSITVLLDKKHQFLQVYTGDTLAVGVRRRGLAVEPYTCAANAFNNHLGLVVLQPGKSFSSSWGIAVTV